MIVSVDIEIRVDVKGFWAQLEQFKRLIFLRIVIRHTPKQIFWFLRQFKNSLDKMSSIPQIQIYSELDFSKDDCLKRIQEKFPIKFKPIYFQIPIIVKQNAEPIPSIYLDRFKKADLMINKNVSYLDQHMHDSCHKVQEWACKHLYPRRGTLSFKHPTPFQKLSGIYFSKLIELQFNSCSIHSIEHLCLMKAPILKKIILSNNYISSARVFLKTNSNQINQISIKFNCVTEANWFYENHWKPLLGLQFHMQSIENTKNNFQSGMNWLGFLAKVHFEPQLNFSEIAKYRKIDQMKICISLMNKQSLQ